MSRLICLVMVLVRVWRVLILMLESSECRVVWLLVVGSGYY